ncbi:7-cyano-7-deazaguanine synthase [Legionella sp. CNM-4043-24]|uniref:7-cyano-7-deazaguanine synthase n=1 Tax=Legionella sp. CNM-4043-24 TaxID=3421646 RepID=UPI00403ACCAB
MSKMKIFNFSSQYIWPAIRLFSGSKLSRRCSKCINSEKYTPLTNGICSDCIKYDNSEEREERKEDNEDKIKEMGNMLSQLSQKDIPYHACVLFSGGKDSTLLIYKLMQDYPDLRLLALTIDNGQMSPVALDNIKKIVSKLNLHHLILKPGDGVFDRSFKYAIEQVKGRGCSNVVDMIDGDLFHDVALHFVAQHNIPLLISGLSREQVEDIIKINHFEYPQDRLKRKREYSGVLELNKFSTPADYLHYWWDPAHYSELPRMIYPNYLWNYSITEINEVLEKKCGLSPKETSPIVTNNKLIPIMGIIDIRQIGYSSFEPEFAKMVRRGKVDRKYWLNIFQFIEYLAKNTKTFDKDIDDMFSSLKVDRKEVFE